MNLHRSILLALVLTGWFSRPSASAQQFPITSGEIQSCTGVLEDTGGPAGEYSNGENVTVVICPDTPGDAISLTWAVFSLSLSGSNPSDRILIWDGNSTSAALLGEYSGTDLLGLVISATASNTSGCLTVQFISNESGVGDFAATISCATTAADDFSMFDPEINTCAGVFYDSGGPAGGGYDDNESLTTTICPDQLTGSLSLNFVLFDLDTVAIDDQLVIHDGPTATSPTVGVFTGTSLQSQPVVASAQNLSGCLTLEFTSNDVGDAGYFAATIACTASCPAPVAAYTTNAGDTARICIGDGLVLDGSASLPAPGRTIAQWIWIRPGLANDTTDTPVTSLAFPASGPVQLALQVIDNLGCTSEISALAPVLVSPSPVFNGPLVPTVACVGVPIPLDVDPIQPLMVSGGGNCDPTGEPMYLPDDVGMAFHSETIVNSAEPGSVLTDIAQLGDICLDIEHSFMGDLVISVTCPSGNLVNLYQQGGGGTFLGDANDSDGNGSPEQGTCFTYCFNADPDFGTWVDCAEFGVTPNVVAASQGTALAPGSYQSIQPLDGLLGCPLNGIWTLTITDFWGADNGFLCTWCIGLESDPDSSFLAFGPVLGTNSADSSSWSGMNVVNDVLDATSAEAIITEAGTQEFTYSVTDSYGCVHDTTFSVLVLGPIGLDAGPDLTVCADSVLLNAVVTGIPELTCSYTLTLTDAASDGWNGGASLAVTIGGVTTNHTVPNFDNEVVIALSVTSGQTIQLVYQAGTFWNAENSILLVDDLGNELVNAVNGPSGGTLYSGVVDCAAIGLVFSWSPVSGLSDPTVLTPNAFPATDTQYTITATVSGIAGCSASDLVDVATSTGLPLAITYNATTGLLCASETGFVTYDWYRTGQFIEQNEGPCFLTNEPGAWVVVGTDQQGCIAYSDTVLICPEVTVEYNSGILITQTGFASYTWMLNGQPLVGFIGPILQVQGNGLYTVTITTGYGCTVSASTEVSGLTAINEDAPISPTMNVFPVPNDGHFFVAFENTVATNAVLRVLDMTGRAVHDERLGALHGKVVIPVALAASPGAYFVEARLDDRSLVQRIIVR